MDGSLIPSLPPSCHYIPNFISPTEEAAILAAIQALPPTRWTQLSHRRLLSLPSQLTGAKRDALLSSPLPSFLESPILERFESLDVFEHSPHGKPNHVLINEYKAGEGIMPHEDGPAYFPVTATVSLASHTVLEIYCKTENGEREAKPTWRIIQEPRSLLVTQGDMYKDTLHGISEVGTDEELGEEEIANWELLGHKEAFVERKKERETRVSLTYRDVIKVIKVAGGLRLAGKK